MVYYSPFGWSRPIATTSPESHGYVESSDLPRAGGVVRLELQEFCTSAERLAWANEKGCLWDPR